MVEGASTSRKNEEKTQQGPYTMTEEILRKRLKKEYGGRYITQFYAMVTATMGAITLGTVYGWASPVFMNIQNESNKFTNNDYAWVASLGPLGCSVGVLFWSVVMTRSGPKGTMLLIAPLNILCWVLLALSNSLKMVLVGRFFTGFFSVTYLICGECLLVDCISQKNFRHMYICFRSSPLLGMILAFMLGYKLNSNYLSIVCAGIASLHITFLVFEPESPVFLYKRSEPNAEHSLSWYQGRENIYTDMRVIKRNAESRLTNMITYKYMIFSKVVLRGLLIVLGLVFFEIMTGYYLFIFYKAQVLFGLKTDTNIMAVAAIYSICLYVFRIFSLIVTFRQPFGVRKPLIVSCLTVSISMTCLVVYIYLYEITEHFIDEDHWLLLLILILYLISFEIGLAMYPEFLLTQYMPFEVYQKAKMMMRAFSRFLIFLLINNYMRVKDMATNITIFGFLASVLLLGALFCYFFVIESKGKTLLQIQTDLGGNPVGTRGALLERRRAINIYIT